VKIHRRIVQNPVLRGDAAACLLFRYSIERAAYKATPWDVAGAVLFLQPGQYFACWRAISDDTGLTVKQLRRAAAKLAKAGMLTAEPRANRGILMTVCNYLVFQGGGEHRGQTSGAADADTDGPPEGLTEATLSKKKESRPENKDPLGRSGSDLEFDRFWQAYPRRQGKGAAQAAWRKSAGDRPTIEDLEAVIEQQSGQEQWRRDAGRFIPHPANWLREGRWEDETPPERVVVGPDGLALSEEYSQ
jgi:hypothetical protein